MTEGEILDLDKIERDWDESEQGGKQILILVKEIRRSYAQSLILAHCSNLHQDKLLMAIEALGYIKDMTAAKYGHRSIEEVATKALAQIKGM